MEELQDLAYPVLELWKETARDDCITCAAMAGGCIPKFGNANEADTPRRERLAE